MHGRATLVLAVVAACAAAGCKKAAHRRSGDAAAVEVVTTPALPDGGVPGGPATEEIEPNDTSEVATVLPIGGSVRGKIDPDTDVDRYRIDVASAGALSVMATGLEGLDVVLEIEDASGAVIARSDRGGPRVREGVPNLAVTPGRYTAVIEARKPGKQAAARPSPKKKPARKAAPEPVKPVGGPYEITASMVVPAAGAEREPDDDRGSANDLIAGDTGTGYLGWTGDVDVWKISVEALSARNALDVELSAVEGVTLQLEIADGIGKPIVRRKGARGGPLVVRGFVPAVPAGAPPFLHLIVRDPTPREGKEVADRSNPETAYQIRAIARVIAPDAELEPDDTPETAMPVPADRKSLHAHWSTGDVDCFAVPPDPAARTIEVSIDMPNELDLAIDLLIDDKLVEKSDHPGKGAAEKVKAVVPGGARAVIRVRGADATADAAYELAIDETPAPP
ncbi:MAG TPA: hypothetical protein VFK02_31120 [Kofleriaceae bacterium]|nr:hypothetical protein [Kofleriaceae bacterium]